MFGVLAQWGMGILLSVLSMQQLHRMGKSASQKILSGSGMLKVGNPLHQ